MLSLLRELIDRLVCLVQTAIVTAVNWIVAGLGALIEALAAVLPDMPDLPAIPSPLTTALGWINWVFPVEQVALFFTFILAAWLLWQATAIALRWAKAISD